MKLAVICAIAFATLCVVSCAGSESNDDLEEYFSHLTISPELERRFVASAEQYNQSIEGVSDEDMIQRTREFLTRSAPLIDELAEGFASVEPPEIAEVAHQELVDSITAYGRAMREAEVELGNVAIRREAQEVYARLILAAQLEVDSACQRLLALAEAEGITPSASASCGLSPLQPNVLARGLDLV